MLNVFLNCYLKAIRQLGFGFLYNIDQVKWHRLFYNFCSCAKLTATTVQGVSKISVSGDAHF